MTVDELSEPAGSQPGAGGRTKTGLTGAEVEARIARGEVNDVPVRSSRSMTEIVKANVFTRFNAIIGVLFLVILVVGPVQDGLFGFVIVANTAIGIIQEWRAKKTLDGLAVIGEANPPSAATAPPSRSPSPPSCWTTSSSWAPVTRSSSTAR